MFEMIAEAWTSFKSLPPSWILDIGRSLMVVLVMVLIHVVVSHILAQQPQVSLEARRRWMVNVRNILLVSGLAMMASIWSQELAAIAVSMVAIAAAVAISGKEVIMCFLGSIYRSVTRSYSIGDAIVVNHFRGRVVDFNLFGTTIMEVGPGADYHSMTGRELTFPNSLLLTTPVIREENSSERYTVHVIRVPLLMTHDLLKAEKMLLDAALAVCEPYLADAQRFMERLQATHLVDSPSVQPRSSIHLVDEEHALLTVRLGIPFGHRQRVEQQVIHKFIADFFGTSLGKEAS